MTVVRSATDLLTPLRGRGAVEPRHHETIVRACQHMAVVHRLWQQSPESWTPPDSSAHVQFCSLVSHLLDAYPVPKFMAPVWCLPENLWQKKMYLHLAAGKSIRHFRLPLPYSVRMSRSAAQWFMQAPDDILPIKAYRWAQVRSLGGDPTLANTLIMCEPLWVPTLHEAFWESVIRFLVASQPLCAAETRHIVHFIDSQRFQPARSAWGAPGPPMGCEPLQPQFTVKGRSLMSLRRLMTNWRERFRERFAVPETRAGVTETNPQIWNPTSIRPFRKATGDVLWTIDELLTDVDLRIEGRMMQHCVATYVRGCASRRTSIWSMKVNDGDRRQRTVTIEVVPDTRIIWQAKGRRNRAPGSVEQTIICEWADREGLRFRDGQNA